MSIAGAGVAGGGSRKDKAERVPTAVKLGYSAGLFGISMVQTSVTVLLMYFYTDFLHIPPAQAGGIVFVGTLVDAFSNLAAAWIATHHKSRLGVYRPFLIYVAGPLAVCFAAMFTRPDLPVSLLFAYALVTHLAYRVCYAFTLMPHASLISRLSPDADERASVGAWKAVANNLGLMTAAYFGISTIEQLGGSDQVRGFMIFGVIFGAIAGLSVFISGMTTREKVRGESMRKDTGGAVKAIGLVFRNDQIVVVLAATLLFFIGYALMNSGVVYYFKYILGRPQEAKLAIVAIGVGGIVMPPAWSWIIHRTSKAVVWATGCSLMVLAFAALFGAGVQALGVLLAIYLVIGIGKSAVIVNYYAMIADAVDYGQWKQGDRAEAYGFGLLSLANKVGTAIGGGLLGLLLSWTGLVVNTAQSQPTIGRLWIVTCIAPAAFFAVSAATVLLFRITAARHRQILVELAGE